jgi:hypothetical protein
MNDGYRCQLCGAWIEIRNLTMVLAHEGPLPHFEQDRPPTRAQKAAKALTCKVEPIGPARV